MPADDPAPPAARPPHPATLPHEPAAQPKLGKGRSPHPATVQRKAAEPPKAGKTRGPHPATVQRKAAELPRPGKGRGPHPATVQRKAATQPKRAGSDRAPHPATLSRGRAGSAIQPMARSGKKAKKYKKGSKGGVEVMLNGKKAFATQDKSKAAQHAERLAVASAPKGDIGLEQNAWPCSECHIWLAQQSQKLGVTITVTVTEDHGSYSMDHVGVDQGATGTIVYAKGAATVTVD